MHTRTVSLAVAMGALALSTTEGTLAAQAPRFHPDFRLHGKYVGAGTVAFQWYVQKYFWFFGWHKTGSPKLHTIEVNTKDAEFHLNQLQQPAPGTITGWGKAPVTQDGSTATRITSVSAHPFGPNRQTGRLTGHVWTGDKKEPFLSLDLWYFESADGMSLSLQSLGRSLVLRKDTSVNQPPTVAVSAPQSVLAAYKSYPFSATVTDTGPGNIPDERVVWWARRKGESTGWFYSSRGRQVALEFVMSGEYEVFCQAYDRGGLRGWGQALIKVGGDAPHKPTIVRPVQNGVYFENVPIELYGSAWDPEDGALSGSSLTWKAGGSLIGQPGGGPVAGAAPTAGNAPFQTATLPAGQHTITLEATDSSGLTSPPAQVAITVAPYNGKSPPQAAIVKPDISGMSTPVVLVVEGKDPVLVVGSASDFEDPLSSLKLEWFVTDVPSAANPIVAMGPVKATGPTYQLPYSESGQPVNTSKIAHKRLVFRVTDTDAMVSEFSVHVAFFGQGWTIQ